MEGNATASSHSWTIKTKDNTEIKRYEPPPPPAATLTDPFEDRLEAFINNPATRTMVTELHSRSVTELNRRHMERLARKSNGNITVPAPTRPKTPTEETPTTTVIEEEQQQQHPYQFLDVSTLTSVDQKAWHTNIRKDTGTNYPHRWLRLASLFSVQSRTLRQPSFLTAACERSALQDLDSQPSVMDNYLKIRDIQNRNYAIEAVQEGIKEFEKKNLTTAMECYKRAMDMDGKYAEAYYRVAEVMLHENKKRLALERLDYALRLDPQHEGAKALKDTLVTRKRDERSHSESNASRHRPRSTSRHDDQQRQRSKDTRQDDYRSRDGHEEDRESRGSSSHRTKRRHHDRRREEEDGDRRSRRRHDEAMDHENGRRPSFGVSDHEEKSHRRRKRDEYENNDHQDVDRHKRQRHNEDNNDRRSQRHRHRSNEHRHRKRREDEHRYRRHGRDYRKKRRHSPDRDRRSPRRRVDRSPHHRNSSSHKD